MRTGKRDERGKEGETEEGRLVSLVRKLLDCCRLQTDGKGFCVLWETT